MEAFNNATVFVTSEDVGAIFNSPNTGDVIKVNLKGTLGSGRTYSFDGNMTYTEDEDGGIYASDDGKCGIASDASIVFF